jgi:hypothetical protein
MMNAKSFNTNGFVSKYFNISRSCRQGSPIAPLVYILQAEPVACAIRRDSEIQGIKLPGGKDGEYIGRPFVDLKILYDTVIIFTISIFYYILY